MHASATRAAPSPAGEHRHPRRGALARLGAFGALAATLLLGSTPSYTQTGERLIHRANSAFNGTLVVSETESGLRVLRFEPRQRAQSVIRPGDPDHLELAYTRAVPAALTWLPEPRRILVVGLGGGTLPVFLHRRLPAAQVDVVELDPAVVEVARSHFDFREDARMRAHVADGRRWIEQSTARYDLIVLDAYGTDAVPYALATREFLESVRRVLTPGGVVVGNLWGRGFNLLYDDMVRTYLDVFPQLAILDIEGVGNKLVIASPARQAPDRTQVLQRAAEITRRLALRTDLVPLVERGLRPVDERERAGRVLTDGNWPAPR